MVLTPGAVVWFGSHKYHVDSLLSHVTHLSHRVNGPMTIWISWPDKSEFITPFVLSLSLLLYPINVWVLVQPCLYLSTSLPEWCVKYFILYKIFLNKYHINIIITVIGPLRGCCTDGSNTSLGRRFDSYYQY